MANKILNTRLQLRYDSIANWNTKANSVPLRGEVCIVDSGTISPDVDDVLLKVGDGSKTFAELPWVSAKAADVHSWAKKSWDEFKADILPVITAAVSGGDELTAKVANNVVTIDHDKKLSGEFSGASATSVAEKDKQFVITVPKLTVNEFGHVTAAEDVTYTVVMPSDHTSVVAEGTKIDVTPSVSGDVTTYTVSHEATTRNDGTVATDNVDHEGSITVITAVESDATGHITAAKKTTFTLPEDNNTTYDLGTDVGGKLVLSSNDEDPDVVTFVGDDATSVTSDASGKITISSHDTKSTLKTATGGKLGLHEDDALKSTITFVGGGDTTVTSTANGTFTISSHDTQYDIGAAASGANADINLNKDGTAFDKVTLAAGENVTLSVSGDVITVSAKDDDTLYTAGEGLGLDGTEFKHAVPTKVASNVSAADRTYVKSVSFDKFGHVTEIATGTETVVDTDTKTSVKGDNKYIDVAGTLTENSDNEFTVSIIESALIDLIGKQTVAAMEFKGATSSLPANPTKGDMYKVSGSFTVAGETAKVGDSIVYDGTQWYLIPSGDDIEDTWRQVIVDGKNLGGTGDGKTLKFVDGAHIEAELAADGESVSFNHAKSTIDNKAATKAARTYVDSVTVDEFGHVTGVTVSSETIEHNPDLKIVAGDTGSFTATEDGDSFKIAGDGAEISTSVSGDIVTVAHATHVTAGTVAGTSSSAAVAHGSKIAIPSITYNAAGHITATSTTEFQLPTNTEVTITETPDSASLLVTKTPGNKDANGNDTVEYNITHKKYETANVAKVADASVAHGGTIKAITGLSFEEGHVTGVDTTTYTLPEETNAFAKVTPANSTAITAISKNTTSVIADTTSDELTIAAGNKWVELAGDATNDKITIAHAVGTAGQTTAPSLSTAGVLTTYGVKWDEAGHTYEEVAQTVDLTTLVPDKDNDTLGKNVVGASATATTDGASAGTSENGKTVDGTTQKVYTKSEIYLNHVETLDGNSRVASKHAIKGGAFTSVTSDASGNITVSLDQTKDDVLILNCGSALDFD